MTDSGWTASVTWQIATLSIVSFLIGAVSALPWRAGPLGGPALTAAMVLLVPLLALLAALGLGLVVAARVRRTTLSRVANCAAHVRQAMNGEIDSIGDPLGTEPSRELARAITDVLVRARRS
jgi:glucose dehydrogenase